MRFLILGRSVGKRKKNAKIKLENCLVTVVLENNKAWLQQWRKEKSTSLLESNENREKAKKSKSFGVKFETMCHCLTLRNFFFFFLKTRKSGSVGRR